MTVRRFLLRRCHRLSGLTIGLFLIVHLANHGVGLAGQAHHMHFMAAVRPFYRNGFVQPLLFALIAFQTGSGATLVIRGWRGRRGTVAWAQALSGLYLIAFLANHVLSVLAGRRNGLDTDIRFAAAGMQVPPFQWFFIPYYGVAVAALFVHLGCAAYWALCERHPRRAAVTLGFMALAGAIYGGAIVAELSGALYPLAIPARYLAAYRF